MQRYEQPFWRNAPFIRLLVPVVAGIVLGRTITIPLAWPLLASVAACAAWLVPNLLRSAKRYAWRWLQGAALNLLVLCGGCLALFFRDITHRPDWVGNAAANTRYISVTLTEPLQEKPHSFKAIATIDALEKNGHLRKASGRLLLYFKKDGTLQRLHFGTQLLLAKQPQRIAATANPGGFDYAQYCALQDVYHQAYLLPGDFVVTGEEKPALNALLLKLRDNVLSVLRACIPGQTEAGVAEALLIGYRNDLDKDLVRAYSITGVVHIIAISGLHLGMIYGLMLWLLKPFRKYRCMRWLKPLAILFVLWGFSLLAGAAASILRSAVMFSFIVVGESLGRRSNVYNTLAASAFCLLVYDPYFCWDVGFQLSYAAVVSIVLFSRPVYQWLYIKNKMLNSVWQLNSITLAAQVLTLPLILFYFHQFPNLFLFSNFVAVPLSGLVLYGELVLLLFCKIPLCCDWIGQCLSFLLRLMNGTIERTGSLPFAVTDDIFFDLPMAILLYAVLACFSWWLLRKNTRAMVTGTLLLTIFCCYRSAIHFQQSRQRKLIVYNLPKQSAIEIIEGSRARIWFDETLATSASLQRQHLAPAHNLYGVRDTTLAGEAPSMVNGGRKTVLFVGPSFFLAPAATKIPVDLVVLLHNPDQQIPMLARVFDCDQYVFDNSNALWKIRYWKKQADSLHLRHHTVSEQGAFEMDL